VHKFVAIPTRIPIRNSPKFHLSPFQNSPLGFPSQFLLEGHVKSLAPSQPLEYNEKIAPSSEAQTLSKFLLKYPFQNNFLILISNLFHVRLQSRTNPLSGLTLVL
jgi:hypothetical protein